MSKGWSEQEIAHAKKVFVRANKENPHTTHKHWLLLVLGVIGVVILALYLTPILLLLPAIGAYPITLLVGLLFGRIITEAFRSFHHEHHHIRTHHHLSVKVVMPLAALMSLFFFLLLARTYQEALPVVFSQTHNITLLCLLFALGLLLPYIHYHNPKNIKRQ